MGLGVRSSRGPCGVIVNYPTTRMMRIAYILELAQVKDP